MDWRPSTPLRNPVRLIEEYFRSTRISPGFGLLVNVNPARYAEQAHFRVRLVEEQSGNLSADPIFVGLFSAGAPVKLFRVGWMATTSTWGHFWTELHFSFSTVSLDIAFFKLLGGLIPPGGSLMVSYSLYSKESKIHRESKESLDRGYPPVGTPLGFLLFTGGCGIGFKDWYFAEGGREGPEKLQGYKPCNSEIAKQKVDSMLRELRDFVNCVPQDAFAQGCKSRAERVIIELELLRRIT